MSTPFVKKITKFLPLRAVEEKTKDPACRIFSFFSTKGEPDQRIRLLNIVFLQEIYSFL